jgi:hypothetical protein
MSCKCQRCGKNYSVDFNVPDDIWEIINRDVDKGHINLLCPECVAFGIVAYHALSVGKKKFGSYEIVTTRQHNKEENSNSAAPVGKCPLECNGCWKVPCTGCGTDTPGALPSGSPNNSSDAIALLKEVSRLLNQINSISKGSPIHEKINAVLAQQHTC